MENFKSVDDYIQSFDPEIKSRLMQMRSIVKQLAPDADEKISYGIPYYSFYGRLVYFGGFRDHISLFPASKDVFKTFEIELNSYQTSAGTIRFKLEEPLPLGLIRKIVSFRVRQNRAKNK